MELANTLENSISTELVTENIQNNFLNSTLGKVINFGLDTGLRILLPDLIENQVIDIKDAILNNGFSAGVKKAISTAIDLGKSALGIFTGKFENIEQARNVVKSGGLLDNVSNFLDKGINFITKSSKIPMEIGNIISKGKNVILDTISNNIEENFDTQINSIQKLSKYSTNWKDYYKNHDFSGMEREYRKIKDTIKDVLPLENTIKEIRRIENLHTLIKNKNGDFNLTDEEVELANKLI